MSKDIKYTIYLPPGYSKSKELPVLYYLHGFGGNYNSSINFTNFVDSLIVNNNFPNLIIISPNADKTWYVDNADSSVNYATMFIKEFIPFIKKKYAVTKNPKQTIIAGRSMGGFGAMLFSMKYPDIFGICVGFQAAIDIDYQFKNMGEANYKKYQEHVYGKKESSEAYIDNYFYEIQPLYIAQKLNSNQLNKVKWYFQCCDNDYHSAPNAQLHVEFRKKEVVHEYRVLNGEHNGKCIASSLPEAIEFIKTSLLESL